MKSITYWNDVYTDRASDIQPHYINQYSYPSSNLLVELKKYLKSFGPLPIGTSYLGTCNDGLPLFMDFRDSSIGSILITGNDLTRLTHFLRVIIASSMTLNPSNNIQCSIISPNIGLFSDLTNTGHMDRLYSSYETAAFEHIIDLAILAEQRRSGRHIGPIHILAIDNIIETLKYQDFETSNHLSWLISNGPINSIFVVASIDKDMIHKADRKVIKNFGTYIFNTPALDKSHLLNDSLGNSVDVYSIQFGNQSYQFYLPLLD